MPQPCVLNPACRTPSTPQGLGEGVALPSMNNLVARHVPPSAKARALGMCFSGFHSGAWCTAVPCVVHTAFAWYPGICGCPVSTPFAHSPSFSLFQNTPTLPGNLLGLLLSPFILVTFGWRALFLVFGVLGGPLLAVWSAVVPDKPPVQQPQKAAAAAAAADGGKKGGKEGEGGRAAGGGDGVTLGKLLSHPATWAIVIVNFVNHWGYFIYLNWMPTYFSKVGGWQVHKCWQHQMGVVHAELPLQDAVADGNERLWNGLTTMMLLMSD